MPFLTRGRVAAGALVLLTAAPVLPAAASGDTLSAQLQRLRVCESSDNYRINTGNGYYGAYQFAPSTWHALGFAGRPDRSPAATQDRAATKLHAESGWSSWPGCARKERLH